MFMTTKEILSAMRAKLERPEQWTQHRYARLKDGSPVRYGNTQACSYCMEGALFAVAEDEPNLVYAISALQESISAVSSIDIFQWNDTDGRTHAEVLDVIDRAIAAIK